MRTASLARETRETRIEVSVDLDGSFIRRPLSIFSIDVGA